MPGPYSRDLRERVLLVCERGRLSRAKIAKLFQVAESTVYRWLQTWRSEGRREAKPHAGGPAPRLDQAALEKLKAIERGRKREEQLRAKYAVSSAVRRRQ